MRRRQYSIVGARDIFIEKLKIIFWSDIWIGNRESVIKKGKLWACEISERRKSNPNLSRFIYIFADNLILIPIPYHNSTFACLCRRLLMPWLWNEYNANTGWFLLCWSWLFGGEGRLVLLVDRIHGWNWFLKLLFIN